jgi:hypothetical protein
VPTARAASTALIVGTIASFVTMGLHPTGADAIRIAAAGGANAMIRGVHILAIAAQPLLLVGLLGVTVRLPGRRDLAVLAYISFAMACVAVMIAAVASGFIAPNAAASLAASDDATRPFVLTQFAYTGRINQAFAQLYVGLSGLATLLWSVAMRGDRRWPPLLSVLGVLVSLVLIAGQLSGRWQLHVTGFGVVVLLQGLWLVWTAISLRHLPEAPVTAPVP